MYFDVNHKIELFSMTQSIESLTHFSFRICICDVDALNRFLRNNMYIISMNKENEGKLFKNSLKFK